METIQEIKAEIAENIQDCDTRRVMDMYRAEVASGIPLDKFKEICEAYRDGRCVVLPCKVGDTVYAGYDGKIHEGIVNKIVGQSVGWWFNTDNIKSPVLNWNWFYAVGKTVFLTRPEAEAALKGGATG